MQKINSVDEYIMKAPLEMRDKLVELRRIIKSVAKNANERISYGMPFYEYKGRLVYFGVAKKHIGLYFPPPVIEAHADLLREYVTTKSAVHLRLDRKLPVSLIKMLIKARMKINDKKKSGN